MKIITKKKLREECWNLDYELIKWLNEHLKIYKKDAGKMVDLNFYEFKHNKKTYTLEDMIDRAINLTDLLLKDYDFNTFDKNTEKIKNEVYDIFKKIHWNLWW